MRPESATPPFAFPTTPAPLVAAFDGGRVTPDGGLPWLARAEEVLGICAAFTTSLRQVGQRGPA